MEEERERKREFEEGGEGRVMVVRGKGREGGGFCCLFGCGRLVCVQPY